MGYKAEKRKRRLCIEVREQANVNYRILYAPRIELREIGWESLGLREETRNSGRCHGG
jgi:hypothetical protein